MKPWRGFIIVEMNHIIPHTHNRGAVALYSKIFVSTERNFHEHENKTPYFT
jgi:hypothetical protein